MLEQQDTYQQKPYASTLRNKRFIHLTSKVVFSPKENLINMWQFPNETLSIKEGDCEDRAILLCSMIRYYDGERYGTECVWITGSSSAHVGVQIPVSGGKLVILDPEASATWGNTVSKDISTEINDWLNYWKPALGSDVRVYRVFANYIDKTFSSTSEYTSWMYSR
jgi:hypothetical protein